MKHSTTTAYAEHSMLAIKKTWDEQIVKAIENDNKNALGQLIENQPKNSNDILINLDGELIHPMNLAAKKGSLECFKYLQGKYGDDECSVCGFKLYYNFSSLYIAAETGQLEIIKYLKEKDIITRTGIELYEEKLSPLHFAAKSGQVEVVKFLLEECEPLYFFKNSQGMADVHIAAEAGHIEVVKCVKKPEIKTRDGRTPLHIAAAKGNISMAKCLTEQYEKEPNFLRKEKYHQIKSNNGMTALHCAAFEGSTEMIEYLIEECGADWSVRDETMNGGRTPLRLAIQGEKLENFKLLLQYGATARYKPGGEFGKWFEVAEIMRNICSLITVKEGDVLAKVDSIELTNFAKGLVTKYLAKNNVSNEYYAEFANVCEFLPEDFKQSLLDHLSASINTPGEVLDAPESMSAHNIENLEHKVICELSQDCPEKFEEQVELGGDHL